MLARVEAGWSEAATAFGRPCFALMPSVALAGFITVLTHSSASGIAPALGYFFGEQLAVAILMNLFDWFQTVADFALGRNITAWLLGAQGEEGGVGGVLVGAGGIYGEFPGELHAFLVLAAYILVLGGAAFWLFHRRDVPSAGGG